MYSKLPLDGLPSNIVIVDDDYDSVTNRVLVAFASIYKKDIGYIYSNILFISKRLDPAKQSDKHIIKHHHRVVYHMI